jgi:transcriptional regulator with XRE-family HTH domain
MKDVINEKYIRNLVSTNLKRFRAAKKISQLALANNTGLTHNFINDIENCKKGISVRTLAKLSVALNVEPHQFFLPGDKFDNDVTAYVTDFNDSLQKLVKDLSAQYLPPEKKQ